MLLSLIQIWVSPLLRCGLVGCQCSPKGMWLGSTNLSDLNPTHYPEYLFTCTPIIDACNSRWSLAGTHQDQNVSRFSCENHFRPVSLPCVHSLLCFHLDIFSTTNAEDLHYDSILIRESFESSSGHANVYGLKSTWPLLHSRTATLVL